MNGLVWSTNYHKDTDKGGKEKLVMQCTVDEEKQKIYDGIRNGKNGDRK